MIEFADYRSLWRWAFAFSIVTTLVFLHQGQVFAAESKPQNSDAVKRLPPTKKPQRRGKSISDKLRHPPVQKPVRIHLDQKLIIIRSASTDVKEETGTSTQKNLRAITNPLSLELLIATPSFALRAYPTQAGDAVKIGYFATEQWELGLGYGRYLYHSINPDAVDETRLLLFYGIYGHPSQTSSWAEYGWQINYYQEATQVGLGGGESQLITTAGLGVGVRATFGFAVAPHVFYTLGISLDFAQESDDNSSRKASTLAGEFLPAGIRVSF